MFKALGISKKQKPASDGQISKHREQEAMRDQWRADAQGMLGILSKLGQAYGEHKGDFALGRYEGLKGMIKGSVSEYNVLLAQTKARTLGKYGDVAKQYGVKGDGKAPAGGGSGNGSKQSALASLKQNAHALASQQEGPRSSSDLSAKEVEEDLTRFRREILQYKQDFKEARDRLDKLTSDYESSKKFSPPQRYNELKNMIKIATRPGGQIATTPSGQSTVVK